MVRGVRNVESCQFCKECVNKFMAAYCFFSFCCFFIILVDAVVACGSVLDVV